MMQFDKWLILGAFMVILVAASVTIWQRERPPVGSLPTNDFILPNLWRLIGREPFPPVESPWNFEFPADHGNHEPYRTERWHLAGVLNDESDQSLGIEFALIRLKLSPNIPESSSNWSTSTIYGGLFTISDPEGERLIKHQRLTRGALDLAGAKADPIVKVWVENWGLTATGDNAHDFILEVAAEDHAINLTLRNLQPLIDTNNLRRGTAQPGQPFQFYMQPRMAAEGSLHIGEQRISVSGILTFEHAWGELPLPGAAVALDRFYLYLNNERELFLLRRHRVDGSDLPATTGILISASNRAIVIPEKEISLEAIDYWYSAQTKMRYPVRWTLQIPAQDIALELGPSWENQEGRLWSQSFWSGPIWARGKESTVEGHGLMHLNGDSPE